MAKVIYSGVSNKARKIKSCYVGVTDKARKITKAYIGMNNVARLCYTSDIYPVGTYWLIDSSGTKCYNSSGTLISSNSNTTSWACMDTGKYSIELHAYGGRGGTGYIDLYARHGGTSSNNYGRAGSGGGGGGSGAIWYNVSLTAGTSYSVSLSTGSSNTTFNSNAYYVACGSNGGAGGSATAGTGGSYGGYTSSGTRLGTSGSSGNKYSTSGRGSVSALSGGSGGSGGSTIGTYGSGGYGSDTPSYSISTSTYTKTYYDYGSGKPGAVIIRRTG